jgi:1-acyl-sn-glycerol-3-phosphate acyltransferase
VATMDPQQQGVSKPRSKILRPEITRLPRLTLARKLFRGSVNGLARILVWMLTRTEVSGLENIPRQGPALIVSNHLGDADVIVGVAYTPTMVDAVAKSELYDFPFLGWLMDTYGVIWVHRGHPDRKALRVCLDALADGRMIAMAPEGRESVTGELEPGVGGAAYLALKSDAPVVPVTFTGTQNERVINNLKGLRRTVITLTVGSPFRLKKFSDFRTSIRAGTDTIMKTLASQLPVAFRGVYRAFLED